MKVLSDRTNKTCSPQHYFASEPEKCFYCEGASLYVRGQQPSKMFKGQNNVWSTAKGGDTVDKLSEGEAIFQSSLELIFLSAVFLLGLHPSDPYTLTLTNF